MAIEIDDARFRQILDLALAGRRIDPYAVAPVLAVAQLASSIDLDDDPAERSLLEALARRLCAVAGVPVDSIRPLSPIPTDDEERAARIAALAPELVTSGTRDLAFALAYLLIAADLELAPVESALALGLERGLAIPHARANELAFATARIVTPSEDAPAIVGRSPGSTT